ncbi:hypothetical protein LGN19_14070 [Burkholderia sp. AU30198]|uniref:hypothetical protein n=1 Tax=Burkholderia sp. AU30198 TaxID=2879627 RepID=UPI001CF322AA|nr:hypothetical protein [Burkholderia sp. AU30198]MCA8294918.1 hypothetical protein [Burkholderia sp. AU30198]
MPTLTIEPLEPHERARLRGMKGGGLLIVVVALVFTAVPVGLVFLMERMAFPLLTFLWVAGIVVITSLSVYLIGKWYEHKVSLDLKANRKFVLDTTVARLDVRRVGGVPSYYLLIADDGPDVPRRRFDVDQDTIDNLRNGERVRIAFVPNSGRVLEIESATYRHRI